MRARDVSCIGGTITGKVAVITGGGSGIGRATALRFLNEGASVVVADLNEAAGVATVESASAQGHADRVRFIRVDVAEESAIERMIALCISEFGRIDCVFNNAGIGGAFGPVMETDVADWDFTFDVMVRGVFLGIKHGARAMVSAGIEGSIINTASVAGYSGGDAPIAYSCAKAAVINLTQGAAVELAPYRIRVNCICPGVINTPMLHRAVVADRGTITENLQPWPEPGIGEHIAGAALFLAGDDARFVTGEALAVDGGLKAAGGRMIQRLYGSPAQGVPNALGLDRGTTGLGPIRRKQS